MGPVELNLMILLGLIPVGVGLAWGLLRGLDKLGGFNFRDQVVPTITSDPLATSIYFSARFVGVLYLVGQLCTRFV